MRKLVCLVAVVFLAACGGGDPAVRDDGDVPANTTPEVTEDASQDEESTEELPTLTSVPFGEYGTQHIDPPVEFATSPSTGGNHYPFWQNCGYYTVEVPEGAATHTLEHGAVWITYNANEMSDEDLAVLSTLSDGNQKLLITPYDHDDAVILSAWGVQQRGVPAPASAAGTAAITDFIAAWVDNPELAEAGVPCDRSAGVPPDQPRMFPDGELVPDIYN